MPVSLGYVAWERAVQRGNIVLLGAASYFIPLLSIIAAGPLLNIPIHGGVWLGCALVIAGALACKRAFRVEAAGSEAEMKREEALLLETAAHVE